MPNTQNFCKSRLLSTLCISLGLSAAGTLGVSGATSVVVGAVGLSALVGLAPEPDPIPLRWQLSVEPGPLRVMTVDVPSTGPRSYYFFTYKVTNTSNTDLLFAPSFDLGGDTGELRRSGRDVPPEVSRRILADLESKEIQDQIGVVGLLLQGEENAREGVVIWPATATHASGLTIYAAGFSGETRQVQIKDPKSGSNKNVMLRKTLMLRYQGPGEIRNMAGREVELVEERWIMR
jgi:hypothetical protein